jgi:hypothetical protein
MAHLEGRAYPFDHQLQAVGLDGQKTEKNQGMSNAWQLLATHVGLSDHILEQSHRYARFDMVQGERRWYLQPPSSGDRAA